MKHSIKQLQSGVLAEHQWEHFLAEMPPFVKGTVEKARDGKSTAVYDIGKTEAAGWFVIVTNPLEEPKVEWTEKP